MSSEVSIEAIQQRMQQVRCELGHEVEDLVASARDMTDWRIYVRSYPWACLGAAAAVGYLLAPRGHQPLRISSSDLERFAHVAHTAPDSTPSVTKRLGGAITKALALAALRGAMAYFGQRIAKSNVESTIDGEVPF